MVGARVCGAHIAVVCAPMAGGGLLGERGVPDTYSVTYPNLTYLTLPHPTLPHPTQSQLYLTLPNPNSTLLHHPTPPYPTPPSGGPMAGRAGVGWCFVGTLCVCCWRCQLCCPLHHVGAVPLPGGCRYVGWECWL